MLSNFFIRIFNVLKRHKVAWFTFLLLLAVFSFYRLSHFKYSENITDVLPAYSEYQFKNQLLEEIGYKNKLVFHVYSEEENGQFSEIYSLAEKLDSALLFMQNEGQISKLLLKVNSVSPMDYLRFFEEHIPFYLDSADYAFLASRLNQETLDEIMQANFAKLVSPLSTVQKSFVKADPLGFVSPKMRIFQKFSPENLQINRDVLASIDGKHILGTATLVNKQAVNDLQELVKSLSTEQMKVQVYGGAIVAEGNAKQVKTDILTTVGVAMFLIFLLLVVFFRDVFVVFKLGFPVLLSGVFSLLLFSFFIEEYSVVALSVASVVFGISMDYTIHIYIGLRHHQYDVKKSYDSVVLSIIISALTTAATFFVITLLDAKIFDQLGLIASGVLLFSALLGVLLLPLLIKKEKFKAEGKLFHIRWFDFLTHRWAGLAALLVLVLVCFFGKPVRFEGDMMKLNYLSTELEEAEKSINHLMLNGDRGVLVAFEGKSFDEALQKAEQYDALIQKLTVEDTALHRYNSITEVLLSQEKQQYKIATWNTFWQSAENKDAIMQKMYQAGQKVGFNASVFASFEEQLGKEYKAIQLVNNVLLSTLSENYLVQIGERYFVVNQLRLSAEASVSEVIYGLTETDKNVLLIDNRQLTNDMVGLVQGNFNQLLTLSSVLVFLILLISYGRIELALISYIPIAVSWFVITGVMGMLGIGFNIVNIIICPLIFGVGVDYCVFNLNGMLQAYEKGEDHGLAVNQAVFLSVLTTISGVGVLIFAKHPALQSIAMVSVIGLLTVVFYAFSLQKGLFNLLIAKKVKAKQEPLTALRFLISVVLYTVFFAGAMLMSVVACFVGEKSWSGKFIRRRFLSKAIYCFSYSMMYFPFLSWAKKDLRTLDFSKPSVLIVNHQSMFDIMLMLALSPKVIMVTNKWVWNSPVFGYVVRKAGFVCVDEGYEEMMSKLQERVKQGYTIVIFPEGTRSETSDLKRFHKGAFYLAQELNLDVQPLVLVGMSEILPKNAVFMSLHQVQIQSLERVSCRDEKWGVSYKDRGKSIATYFKQAYYSMLNESENEQYFAKKIIHSYLYKGPVLEWYTRVKIKMENNYAFVLSHIPQKGLIYDIGCGYGYLSYMMQLTSSDRKIVGIDYDVDKIAVAQHNYLRSEKLNFTASSALDFAYEKADAFILCDFLHYLPMENQEALLRKLYAFLLPGGIIFIRDADTSLEKKQRATQLTEFFSTNLGFNKKENQFRFVSKDEMLRAFENTDASIERIDQSKFLSNVFYIIKKPGETAI